MGESGVIFKLEKQNNKNSKKNQDPCCKSVSPEYHGTEGFHSYRTIFSLDIGSSLPRGDSQGQLRGKQYFINQKNTLATFIIGRYTTQTRRRSVPIHRRHVEDPNIDIHYQGNGTGSNVRNAELDIPLVVNKNPQQDQSLDIHTEPTSTNTQIDKSVGIVINNVPPSLLPCGTCIAAYIPAPIPPNPIPYSPYPVPNPPRPASNPPRPAFGTS